MTPQELAELDLAVAKAEGIFLFPTVDERAGRQHGHAELYQPTRDGAEAMRLLEKYLLAVFTHFMTDGTPVGYWMVTGRDYKTILGSGPTPAIAICRAVIALKKDDGRINWAEAMQTGKNRA